MTGQSYFALTVFLLTYTLIVSEKIHRTIAALSGAALIVLAGLLNVKTAVGYIDFNTIGLLTGMMIIVGITRQTGVFEYLAVKAAKYARGEPVEILAALSLITALLSASLDNVTTVLLIVPVTFAITRQLKLNPLPFLISEILASNIGGTATLIGDPPNIMIGGQTHLGFLDFLINLTPVIILIYMVIIFILRLVYRRQLICSPELKQKILAMDERVELKDPVLLKISLLVLGLTVAGFLAHQFFHLESSVIALSGATLLLLLSRRDPERALSTVEWPVIFFFIGLFVVVGALVKTGIIEIIARNALAITGSNLFPAGMLILWLSAIASALVDNIPFVATMIPLIHEMGRLGQMENLNFLWWSLSLGACLGGNGTIIGASANVLVAGMAEKRGYPLTFAGFFKIAFPLTVVSITIATFYLIAWFYLNHLTVLVGTLAVAAMLWLIFKSLDPARRRENNRLTSK